MSNIEEDIEILNNLIAYLNLLIKKGQHKIFYNNLLWDEKTVDCINALENVLAERKQDKEKIKELEVLEDDLKDKRIVYVDTPEFEEYINEFIPKQKIKDVVKEAIEIIESEQFKVIMGDMTKVGRLRYLLEKKLLEDK